MKSESSLGPRVRAMRGDAAVTFLGDRMRPGADPEDEDGDEDEDRMGEVEVEVEAEVEAEELSERRREEGGGGGAGSRKVGTASGATRGCCM